MRIYLAGPMRGHCQFNFPKFHAAAHILRTLGHEVFNPAESDEHVYGKDFARDNSTGNEALAAQSGFSLREALGRDLAWITNCAEAIALLPGWSKSRGVAAELATAKALDLKVLILPAHIDRKTQTLLKALV